MYSNIYFYRHNSVSLMPNTFYGVYKCTFYGVCLLDALCCQVALQQSARHAHTHHMSVCAALTVLPCHGVVVT